MKPAQILIIDKNGFIGEPLSFKLSKQFPVVFVSKWKKFPIIPDNKYSHIIVIDDEGEDFEFLPRIIEKAKGVNSDFIFAQGLSLNGEYLFGKVLKMYSSIKAVLYGDIFDNKLIHREGNFKSVVNEFIYQAQRFQRIQIPGDGLRETYPVFLSEVIDGLVDLVFGINDKHFLFYLFPKHPVTELSLAHMIQKENPEVTIDFIKRDAKKAIISYPTNGKYLLDANYQLAKKIRNINIKKYPPAGGKIEDHKNLQEKFGNTKRFPMSIVWVLIFLIFSPLVFTLVFSFLGFNTLYFAKTPLHLSNTFFNIGKKSSDILSFQLNFIGREGNLKRLLEDIDLGHRMSEGLLQAFNSGAYFSKTLTGKSNDPIGDFAKGQSYLKSSIVTFEKVKTEGKIPAPILQELEIINPLIKLLSSTWDILPGVFGMEGPRTYLILFQNNMELRPGGGFIDSYGILKLNMGKIEEFSIHDVYDADKQLRGHVEPPFAIRRHLPSVHWYMRDSNFDVDFVKSASVSANFLYVETGERSDGVIGVDMTFVKNILEAIGPVYVADYKATIDEKNLYILTQTHSEKDFLRSLYKAVIAKISRKNASYLLIAKALSDSLVQKHLIFAFNNNTQNIFTVNGWSSSLWDERKEDAKSVNDFLGINEANLGINKVNYFISRQISQKVKIENDGNISEELNIFYKNASTSWTGGDYKNYLRIVLPTDTAISEISIQGIPQVLVDAITDPLIYEDKDFKAPQGLEIEKIQEDNKAIYGFIVSIPVGEVVKVKVRYNLTQKAVDINAFSYNLRLFKQPGIDNLPYSFSLFYPNNFNVINTTDGISRGEGKVSYLKKITEDKDLIINFARK